jgi:hypothetical protein
MNGPGDRHGLRVQSSGEGFGVVADSSSGVGVNGASAFGTGVRAETFEDGAIGVRGISHKGRGAVLTGAKAQLRLTPSGANTHPASGFVGDLFLDKHKRLWLCKGGTAWTRLA